MARVRVSTTVDGERLSICRRRLGLNDSKVLDQALLALIERLDAEAELSALERHPYDADADLSWQAPPGPDLEYDDDVPADVVELAAERRRRQRS